MWNTTGIYPQLWVESRSLYPTLAGTAQEWGVSLYLRVVVWLLTHSYMGLLLRLSILKCEEHGSGVRG